MQKTEIEKAVLAVDGNKFDFDVWYAEAWSRKQGGFSSRLANTVIRYIKENNKMIGSVLDICSGSGEFISMLRNIVIDCVGIDNAEGYLSYAKSKHSDVDFRKVDKLYDFKLKKKFDLISCNRDVVNMFTTFDKWQIFFKTVYAHLNNKGLFMFDFYTEKKLANWQDVIYEQGEDLDYVSKISQNNGLCVMNEVYYLKESSVYYRKSGDIMVEAWFKTEDIINALQSAGFKKIQIVNGDLQPVAENEIKNMLRLHIIAEK